MNHHSFKKSSPPNSNIPLPHLVYQIDFLENDAEQQAVWSGKTPEDILENIVNGAGKTRKKDSRVIVVLELPSGGEIIKYFIGNTDDKLEVQI